MDPLIGQIQLFPYPFAPAGWAFCDGQLLEIGQHRGLYALIGTLYGGDGARTFALPDLKGKEPSPDTHYCISLVGIFPNHG